MNNRNPRNIATGGIFAGLAVVIMCMGTLIPVATFVCPMLCMMILQIILVICGGRIALGWYAAVALLSLLLAPDKEAAAVFLFLGYYPILKPKLDQLPMSMIWKVLLFQTAILSMYWILANLLGMAHLGTEFQELGTLMTIVLLILGNVTFLMLDHILGKKIWRRLHGR